MSPQPSPNPVLKFIYENEILGWIALVVGIVGLASTTMIGLGSVWAFGTVCVVSGLMLGISVLGWLARRPSHPMNCLECSITYEIKGVRGAKTHRMMVTVLRVNADTPAFVYAVKNATGTSQSSVIRYRNCGAKHDKNVQWYTLGPSNLLLASTPSGEATVTIQSPAPLRTGDIIEISDELHLNDTFKADDEYVGKTIIYPTKELKFSLEFADSTIENALGTVLAVSPVTAKPLGIEQKDGKIFVSWYLEDAKTQHTYRVSWHWG